MFNFKNCFIDLTSSKQTTSDLPDLNFCYLKVKAKQLGNLKEIPQSKHYSIEIVELNDNFTEEESLLIDMVFRFNKPRLIFTYTIDSLKDFNTELKRYQWIEKFNKYGCENIAVDFYINIQDQTIKNTLMEEVGKFLDLYPEIKHFSLYMSNDEDEGIPVKNRHKEFRRYHKHMWAKDNYHDLFFITTLLEEDCLGVGEKAVSRYKNEYFNLEIDKQGMHFKKLDNIQNDFILFNDHIDRLHYYYQLTPEELTEKYSKITKQEYQDTLDKHLGNVYKTHDELVEKLFSEFKV